MYGSPMGRVWDQDSDLSLDLEWTPDHGSSWLDDTESYRFMEHRGAIGD